MDGFYNQIQSLQYLRGKKKSSFDLKAATDSLLVTSYLCFLHLVEELIKNASDVKACEQSEDRSHKSGEFVELSGGLHGGSEPPAFQCAERERIAMASANKGGDESSASLMPWKLESSQKAIKNDRLDLRENETAVMGDQIGIGGVSDACQKSKDTSLINDDESDGLSDIDDVEVSGYLNNEEEMRFKKIIWEEMNNDLW
ncbi:hypothetical protein F2P56_008160 [Juglans regia]|uniref:Uncharacterized protein LOC108986819 n=2 Tax=Juglans regia TaxID=51240 RepID=A0A2I4E701_JUGRE|nr:uncharacterized protein LOC108986819 [Juglans regia]KAF5476447.1 hypothetical protein F2P56_008160 [Juglans regia]